MHFFVRSLVLGALALASNACAEQMLDFRFKQSPEQFDDNAEGRKLYKLEGYFVSDGVSKEIGQHGCSSYGSDVYIYDLIGFLRKKFGEGSYVTILQEHKLNFSRVAIVGRVRKVDTRHVGPKRPYIDFSTEGLWRTDADDIGKSYLEIYDIEKFEIIEPTKCPSANFEGTVVTPDVGK